MSGPRLPPVSPQPHSLSDTASSIVCRIPELLRRLRDLEREEAELNKRARQLIEQHHGPMAKDEPSTPSHPNASTPVSKLLVRAAVSTGGPGTSPRIDPRYIETPVKTFLLMESFSLAMSIKSKRRGRIFWAGDSTEFGEKSRAEAVGTHQL